MIFFNGDEVLSNKNQPFIKHILIDIKHLILQATAGINLQSGHSSVVNKLPFSRQSQ